MASKRKSSYPVCIIRISVKKRQVLQNYPARPAENEDRGRSPLQSTSRQRTKTSHMIQTANPQRTASKPSSTCTIPLSRMLTGSVSAQESMRKTDLDPLMRGQYLSRSRLQTNLINFVRRGHWTKPSGTAMRDGTHSDYRLRLLVDNSRKEL